MLLTKIYPNSTGFLKNVIYNCRPVLNNFFIHSTFQISILMTKYAYCFILLSIGTAKIPYSKERYDLAKDVPNVMDALDTFRG